MDDELRALLDRMNGTITALANRMDQQKVAVAALDARLSERPDVELLNGILSRGNERITALEATCVVLSGRDDTLSSRIDGLQQVGLQLQQRVRGLSLRLDGRSRPVEDIGSQPVGAYSGDTEASGAANGIHGLLAAAREEERQHWQKAFAQQKADYEALVREVREERDALATEVANLKAVIGGAE